MSLEETPHSLSEKRLPGLLEASEDGAELTLADLQGMEVVGSVPIWALGGLRLHKTGWRQMQPGWIVGVYQLDISAIVQDVPFRSEGPEAR